MEVSASVTALARCSERGWLEASSETESVCPWIWTSGALESLRTAARPVRVVDASERRADEPKATHSRRSGRT